MIWIDQLMKVLRKLLKITIHCLKALGQLKIVKEGQWLIPIGFKIIKIKNLI